MKTIENKSQLRRASQLETIAFVMAAIGALAGLAAMAGLVGVISKDAGDGARDIALVIYVAAFCVKTLEARIRRDLSC
jgi:hypothetical protein